MGANKIRICAAAVAATALAWAPTAIADTQFITVTLPANADLTTYGWCTALGCDQPLRLGAPHPAVVYNAILDVPTGDGRIVAFDSYGLGSWATAEAVRTLLQNTDEPGATTVAAVLLRTPTRPNGGLFTRINQENATPTSNFNAFGGGAPPGEAFDTSFVDVAREYDGFADFPSWFNPLAMLNAAAGAVFLSDYNDTVTWQDPRCPDGTCVAPATWPVGLPTATGDVYAIAVVPDPANPGQTIAIQSPAPVGVAVIPAGGDQTVYYTQRTSTLPLLIPLQLPFDVVNAAVATASQGAVRPHLVNPLVQVLEPPLTALVNLGYTDVDVDAGYTRTLTQPGESVPFGTVPDLTARQWLDVPQDVTEALGDGVEEAVRNPFGLRDTEIRGDDEEVSDASELREDDDERTEPDSNDDTVTDDEPERDPVDAPRTDSEQAGAEPSAEQAS